MHTLRCLLSFNGLFRVFGRFLFCVKSVFVCVPSISAMLSCVVLSSNPVNVTLKLVQSRVYVFVSVVSFSCVLGRFGSSFFQVVLGPFIESLILHQFMRGKPHESPQSGFLTGIWQWCFRVDIGLGSMYIGMFVLQCVFILVSFSCLFQCCVYGVCVSGSFNSCGLSFGVYSTWVFRSCFMCSRVQFHSVLMLFWCVLVMFSASFQYIQPMFRVRQFREQLCQIVSLVWFSSGLSSVVQQVLAYVYRFYQFSTALVCSYEHRSRQITSLSLVLGPIRIVLSYHCLSISDSIHPSTSLSLCFVFGTSKSQRFSQPQLLQPMLFNLVLVQVNLDPRTYQSLVQCNHRKAYL